MDPVTRFVASARDGGVPRVGSWRPSGRFGRWGGHRRRGRPLL